jgi:hypothetical protein
MPAPPYSTPAASAHAPLAAVALSPALAHPLPPMTAAYAFASAGVARASSPCFTAREGRAILIDPFAAPAARLRAHGVARASSPCFIAREGRAILIEPPRRFRREPFRSPLFAVNHASPGRPEMAPAAFAPLASFNKSCPRPLNRPAGRVPSIRLTFQDALLMFSALFVQNFPYAPLFRVLDCGRTCALRVSLSPDASGLRLGSFDASLRLRLLRLLRSTLLPLAPPAPLAFAPLRIHPLASPVPPTFANRNPPNGFVSVNSPPVRNAYPHPYPKMASFLPIHPRAKQPFMQPLQPGPPKWLRFCRFRPGGKGIPLPAPENGFVSADFTPARHASSSTAHNPAPQMASFLPISPRRETALRPTSSTGSPEWVRLSMAGIAERPLGRTSVCRLSFGFARTSQNPPHTLLCAGFGSR